MSTPLLISAALSLAAAAIFARAGYLLTERDAATADDRLASTMFGVWWLGLAANGTITATTDALAALQRLGLPLAIALQFLSLTAICIALWALLHYMTFLFTGSRGYFWPLAVLYAIFNAWLLQAMAGWQPVALQVSAWQVGLVYSKPAQGPALLLLGALVLGPQILAALALYGLAVRLPAGASRRRVIVVATGILFWFGSAVAGSATGVHGSGIWTVLEQVIGMAVATAVLLVYRPAATTRETPASDPGRTAEGQATSS